jgi:WD40 repeat protein
VWELPAEKSKHTLKGHAGFVHSVAFLGSGATLASGAGNVDPSAKSGEVKIWDLINGTEKSTPYKGERSVAAVVATHNGRILAWATSTDVVLWDVNGNKQIATLPGHSWDVAALAIPDAARGPFVAVAGGQEVKLWDMPSVAAKPGKPTNPPAVKSSLKTKFLIYSVAVSPDNQLVAAGGEQGKVTVWDVASGQQKWTGQSKETGDVKGLAFSRDGRGVLIAACGTVQFWNGTTGADLGEWKSEFKEGHIPYSVAVSANGKKLATGGLDGSIKIWDSSTLPADKR